MFSRQIIDDCYSYTKDTFVYAEFDSVFLNEKVSNGYYLLYESMFGTIIDEVKPRVKNAIKK